MADKMKSVDCIKLIEGLVHDNLLLKALGVEVPQTFVVQSFVDAMKSVDYITNEQRLELAAHAGRIAKGLLQAYNELQEDGVL